MPELSSTIALAIQTLSGIGSGAGTITNSGPGALTLSGVNTFTKGLTLNGGTLNINNNAALGTSAGTFTITGGTIDNTSAGAVTAAPTFPRAWNGDFAFTGTQNLNLGTGAVTPNASRQITVNGGTLSCRRHHRGRRDQPDQGRGGHPHIEWCQYLQRWHDHQRGRVDHWRRGQAGGCGQHCQQRNV